MRKNDKTSWNKYDMTFEIRGTLKGEEENKLLGTHKGLLVHINYFQQKENEIIMDNLIWDNFTEITTEIRNTKTWITHRLLRNQKS